MMRFSALILLLGFELCYYLLIVQTGITQHYHSDLPTLSPLFIGGIAGTLLSGYAWGRLTNPIYKIYLALTLQLVLSFFYPDYTPLTLALLGLCVGMMAPLSIYLFKEHQRYELLLALAIAYTVGTYAFTTLADHREWMAILFSAIALLSAILLHNNKTEQTEKRASSFAAYLPLTLWILLDSNLFETLSRHEGLMIWSEYTYTIILFHLLGLLGAFFIRTNERKQHIFIALLFIGSYGLSYAQIPLALAMLYPFTISYYNVIVFIILSKESDLKKLAYAMLLVGWIASGLGLALALSGLLY